MEPWGFFLIQFVKITRKAFFIGSRSSAQFIMLIVQHQCQNLNSHNYFTVLGYLSASSSPCNYKGLFWIFLLASMDVFIIFALVWRCGLLDCYAFYWDENALHTFEKLSFFLFALSVCVCWFGFVFSRCCCFLMFFSCDFCFCVFFKVLIVSSLYDKFLNWLFYMVLYNLCCRHSWFCGFRVWAKSEIDDFRIRIKAYVLVNNY